jgi:hypothetical protein
MYYHRMFTVIENIDFSAVYATFLMLAAFTKDVNL